jgi:uncharacterized protein YbjT (DUF2867 family)
MPGTVLVLGATGNTGLPTVKKLSSLLASTNTPILALSRNVDSPASKTLAALPGVIVEGGNYTELVDAAWLVEKKVEKLFVAGNNSSSQLTDEGSLFVAAKEAGVKYVVRISTFTHSVVVDSPVYYGRSHFAVEAILEALGKDGTFGWTSLQPNGFTPTFVTDFAVPWINEFRSTGEKTPFSLVLDEEAPIALIDPIDIGNVAAQLLALDIDASKQHHGQRYIMNGPENVNGRDIVDEVERITGTILDEVEFRDLSFLDYVVEQGLIEKRLAPSLGAGVRRLWSGIASKESPPTSKAVIDLAAPQTTFQQTLAALL